MSTKNLNTNLITQEMKKFQDSDKDQQLEKIQEMKSELQKSIQQKDEKEDPDNILYTNIERANRFLDILEEKITEKNENDEEPNKEKKPKTNTSIARLFEVSSQLINAITTATQSIAGSYKDDMEYAYKLELLELKNKELMIKSAIKGGGESNTTNNLIVSNREDILDLINNENSEQEGE